MVERFDDYLRVCHHITTKCNVENSMTTVVSFHYGAAFRVCVEIFIC